MKVIAWNIYFSCIILQILSGSISAIGASPTIVIVGNLASVRISILVVVIKLLTICHWVCLHGFECLIIFVINVHLLHLFHHLTGVEWLKAYATVSLRASSRLVDKAYFGDLRLILHALVPGSDSNAAHEGPLRSTVLGAISRGRNVLVCNVKMTSGWTDTICHVLWRRVHHVKLVKSKGLNLIERFEKLVLIFIVWWHKLVDSRWSFVGFILRKNMRGEFFLHWRSCKTWCLIRWFDDSWSRDWYIGNLWNSWSRATSIISISLFISVITEEYIIVIGGLLHHIIVDNVVELFLVILVDIDRSLTHLGAFLVLIHVSISKRFVLLPLWIKLLRLLLIWSLISEIALWWRLIVIGLRAYVSCGILLGLWRWLDLVVLWLPWELLVLWGLILRSRRGSLSYRLDLTNLTLLAFFLSRYSLSWSCWVLHLVISEGIVTWSRRLFLSFFSTLRYRQIPWGKMIFIRIRVVLIIIVPSTSSLRLSSVGVSRLVHAHWHIFCHRLCHCFRLDSISSCEQKLVVLHFL